MILEQEAQWFRDKGYHAIAESVFGVWHLRLDREGVVVDRWKGESLYNLVEVAMRKVKNMIEGVYE